MKTLQRFGRVLSVLLFVVCAAAYADEGEDWEWSPTPPRLSFIDGEVSHGRSGAETWARARVNLALAEGDALYTGRNANFEVQFGERSFVRADEDTELTLLQRTMQRTQFKLTGGRVSFDLGSWTPGDVLEVSTPEGVFVIEHPGYYRVEVEARATHFITRRAGEATATTADGMRLIIRPSEEVILTAGNPVRVSAYAAPPQDAWDRWNAARSEDSGESLSARYLPPDVYGAEDLDRHGHWRVVPVYGPVWVPQGVAPGWTPYSSGIWVWDPFYEWTWVDDAPWGWAPFHYGRWVSVDGYWAWAPGPLRRRTVYMPALVAFMVRDGDVSVRVNIGLPGLWWVALSWGEPVVPWWRRHRHHGHPRWDGWGGPRIVNNVVVKTTTVVRVADIHYSNARLPRAVLHAPVEKFGREPVRATVEADFRHGRFKPIAGELPVKPSHVSLHGGAPRAAPPPKEKIVRPVVSIRPPREAPAPLPTQRPRPEAAPASRYVIPPARPATDPRSVPSRPPAGTEAGPERAPPPLPPRYEEVKRTPVRTQPAERSAVDGERHEPERREARERPLPGQPANPVYRGREPGHREGR